MSLEQIASSEIEKKYRDLGKNLSNYVNELNTSSGIEGLKEAFASGGKIFEMMQSLDGREKEINDSENEGRKQEQQEIEFLKNRLKEFSSVIGKNASGFALTKALDEFSKRIERHDEKVEQGFFDTLVSFIIQVFKEKSEQVLNEALNNLASKINSLVGDLPKQASDEKGKDLNDLEPASPAKSEVIGNIPDAPPLEQMDNSGIPDAPLLDSPPPPPLEVPPLEHMANNKPPAASREKPTLASLSPPSPPTNAKVPIANSPGRNDLLAEIRAKGGTKLKPKTQSLDAGGFTYETIIVKPNSKSDLEKMLGTSLEKVRSSVAVDDFKDEIKHKMKDLSPEKQLNHLYSAVIDGNKDMIGAIVEFGKKRNRIPTESMENVAQAAREVAEKNKEPKKTLIEEGVKCLEEKAQLKSQGEVRGISG